MSTNRTRRTRGRAVGPGGLSESAYEFFAFGPFFDGEEWAAGKSDTEIDDFWKEHREAIMDRFIADMRARGPGWEGRRPEYFWKEITEPRLVTGQRETYSPYPDRQAHIVDVVETDFEFLKRIGLLEPWELKSSEGGKK